MRKLIFLFVLLYSSWSLDAQIKPFATGMAFNDENYKKVQMKAPLTRSLYGASLPSSVSLKKWGPTPRTQGQYGTCVGWSSTYAAFTITQSIKNKRTEKADINQHTYAPLFVYRSISTDNSCATGTYIDAAMETLKNVGAPAFDDFNVECPSYIPPDVKNKAAANRILDYAKLFDAMDGQSFKIEAVKKSLSENKPVVIGMKCADSFFGATGVWHPTEDPNANFGGHAMCVIGYDNNKEGGAFEIQNSWGDTWGNGGYIWIGYKDFANFTKYAYEMIGDFSNPVVVDDNVVDLSGSVRFELSSGKNMQAQYVGGVYSMVDAYRSGTRFRLYLSNNQPAYVYAFGSDLTQQTYKIFPYSETISPILDYSKNDVALPDEDHYVQMDNKVGTDYLCVLYSKEALDLDDIMVQVASAQGSFEQKVKAVLADVLVDEGNVQFANTSKISFQAKSKGKKAVAVIVETKHID